jgi:hypothetical protein
MRSRLHIGCALVLVSACSLRSLGYLTSDLDGGADGGSDAGADGFCASLASPTPFCFDWDESNDAAAGFTGVVTQGSSFLTVTRDASVSAPASLLDTVTGYGGNAWAYLQLALPPSATRVQFDLEWRGLCGRAFLQLHCKESGDAGDGYLTFAMKPTGQVSAHAYPSLLLCDATSCDGPSTGDSIDSLSADWTHVRVEFDPPSMATLSYVTDGGATNEVSTAFPYGCIDPSDMTLEVGLLGYEYQSDGGTCAIGVDNAVVYVTTPDGG